MSLFSNIGLDNGLQIVVWNLTETLEELAERTSLTEEEREAWEAISVPAKKREFLAGKYVLERACTLLDIAYTGMEKDEHGKPHLAGREYEISLTHTEDFIAVAFSRHSAIGIDLEKTPGPDFPDPSPAVLSRRGGGCERKSGYRHRLLVGQRSPLQIIRKKVRGFP
ncbi:MAG: hypothetical protein LRY55_08815 [Leadbetterella sp.]|nr:hypothetical protein [Leadbetterella sp.]